MSWWVGGIKQPEVDIDITMNGIVNNGKRISAQYSYITSEKGRNKFGGEIYPLKGWLEVGVKFASNPGAGTLDIYLLPGLGDDGSRLVGDPGLVDAEYARSTYESHYIGSFHNSDLGTGQRIYTFNIGFGGVTNNPGGGVNPIVAQPLRDRNTAGLSELPPYWSLIVHNNATSVALAADDNYAKFMPIFDFYRSA